VFVVPGLIMLPLDLLALTNRPVRRVQQGHFCRGLTECRASSATSEEYLPKAFPIHSRGYRRQAVEPTWEEACGASAAFYHETSSHNVSPSPRRAITRWRPA